MEPPKHDEQNGNARGERQQSLFAKTVGLDLAIPECPNLGLIGFIVPVQWRQVQIRRGVRDIQILSVSPKQVFDTPFR